MNALICLIFYGVAVAVFFVDGYAVGDSQITGHWRLGIEILLILYGLIMAGFMAIRTHKTPPNALGKDPDVGSIADAIKEGFKALGKSS